MVYIKIFHSLSIEYMLERGVVVRSKTSVRFRYFGYWMLIVGYPTHSAHLYSVNTWHIFKWTNHIVYHNTHLRWEKYIKLCMQCNDDNV